MSSSPDSMPSSVARTTSMAGVFGISNARIMSVSTAPGNTPCTVMPRFPRSARNDCVSDSAAALEALYAASDGMLASNAAGEIVLPGRGRATHLICAAYDYDRDVVHPLLSLL